MRPHLGQALLTALTLSALAAIGWAMSIASSVEVAPLVVTASPATTASATAAGFDAATSAGPADEAASVTATTLTRSRTVSVAAYPSSADPSITITDQAGGEAGGTGRVEAVMTGIVTVEVEAAGLATETHRLAAGEPSNLEVFLDPPDQVVDRTMVFTTGSAPKQVAFSPDGEELWVTLLAGSGLEVYDPATGELVASIDLPDAGSVEVIFDQAGDTAFVSQMETATVYEIDAEAHRIRRELATGGSWTKVMALAPDEQTLWASNWVSNDISEFDLETGELMRRLPTVVTPRGLAIDAAGERLYVAGYDSGDISAIDLDTGESRTIHHSGGAMRHLVADTSRGVIYASDMALDAIFAIDTETDTVTPVAETDRLPNTIDITPDGRVLAVSNRGRNNPETYHLPGPEWGTVLLLDTTNGEVLDAIVGGNQPTGLDISADGEWLAYSDFLDNRVTVVALPPTTELVAAGGGRAGTYRAEIAK